ncbi:hypothetical protein LJC68_06690 [Bacteroidales bacterium OttesenSCG-928-B11]|nr:hypothetical protein [Bacteroidales bacterium OttesenSCG-928-E04]MDL2309447.1 hypothetical protein [Bacteroidales bacterium OttesenSCG-928-C03]MDL2312547.1 hypothetical protein [Bacteroidales bacterium OttesenSCG-928-B11]MDL2326504.1 hypothetical protein [Bacteroidales bacterium OttesenSCG-928-A14]
MTKREQILSLVKEYYTEQFEEIKDSCVMEAFSFCLPYHVVLKIWGKGECVFLEQNNQLHEAGLLLLDITKAETFFNWSPKFDARQALEHAVELYKSYYSGLSMK